MSTVGESAPVFETGNQWTRIPAPSKDVNVQSLATPGTGTAGGGATTGRWQAAEFDAGLAAAGKATPVLLEELEHAEINASVPSATAAMATQARGRPRRVIRRLGPGVAVSIDISSVASPGGRVDEHPGTLFNDRRI